MKNSISSTEYQFSPTQIILGAQMLFVAFGALVLVPLLTGLDSNVALFTAGVGTLIFQYITKGKVPIFLASSFAFIPAIKYGTEAWGIPGTMCGLMSAGLLYIAISFLVRTFGNDFLHKILPPVVTGPVIMVIGLILAPIGVDMAFPTTETGMIDPKSATISLITLTVAILVSVKARGIFRLVPIIIAIIVGYGISYFFGMIQLDSVKDAAWFALPSFTFPTWNFDAILFILPVALAPAIEHFGDVLAIGGVTGKDYVEDPGIKKTMLGDGIATSVAALLGGPPNTTYSEVTGAVTLTKAYNPAIMTWAAIFAIALSFVGKVDEFLKTVPTPVMGGIMLLLFGAIGFVGISILLRNNIDYKSNRNLVIVSLILVTGIGGLALPLPFTESTLKGIGLAGVIGVIANLIIPKESAEKEATSEEMFAENES